MNSLPLVSIVTPCYNAEKYIVEAIESVLSQTYKAWEMIIVDDASTDKSKEIINSYVAQYPNIKLIEHSMNKGTSEGRNSALKEAKGEYIAFLDNDDIWLHQKLKKQIQFMQENMVDMCYSSYFTIDEHGDHTGYFPVKDRVNYNDFLKTSSIGTLTLIYNAKKLGKYYFKKFGHEDYVMKLEMLKDVEYAYGIHEPLAKYRIIKKSLSRNKLKAAHWQWKIYREVKKLSWIKSLYYFINYTYRGFTKYKNV